MSKSYNFAPVVAFVLALGGATGEAVAQYTGPVAISQHTEKAAVPPPVDNQLIASVTGGATLNAGNTRAYTVTVGGHLGLIRNKNQLVLDVLGLINATKLRFGPDDYGPYEKTAANVIGKARYDRFLSPNDALFLAIVPRRDVFAGLDLRMQMQAGYSRNLYAPSDKQRLWTEAGYDGTYDRFAPLTTTEDYDFAANMMTPPPPPPAGVTATYTTNVTSKPDPDFINSARLFFGYSNSMTALAVVNLGAEVLFDLQDGQNTRINTVADFTTSLSTRFKLGFASRMFYDQKPVPGTQTTDFVSTLQVIYTYDSLAGMKKAGACDCTANVQKATEEAQAACAKQYGAPVFDGGALQEPAGVQMPTTTTTPNAEMPAPNTPPAATTPVTPPVVAPTAPQIPVTPSTATPPATTPPATTPPASTTPAKP